MIRPELRAIPIKDAPVSDIRVLDYGQPWSLDLTEDYNAGMAFILLDINGMPVAAYRKRGN